MLRSSCILGVSEHLGRGDDLAQGPVVARRRNDAIVGLCLEGCVRWRLRVEPVAELKTRVPQSRVRQESFDSAGVRSHRRVLARQSVAIAICLPEGPRDPHRRVTPDSGAVGVGELGSVLHVLEHVGDHERHPAVGVALLQVDVDEPVGKEAGGVIEVCRGGREGGDVAGPAQSLARCGQSVGTSMKFPLRPQTRLRCSWFNISSEHSNVPVRTSWEWTTTASRESS